MNSVISLDQTSGPQFTAEQIAEMSSIELIAIPIDELESVESSLS